MGVEELKRTPGCQVDSVSAWINTAPYGGVEQEDFLNGALEIETLLEPEELLEALHQVENAEGRERIVRWGPRTLDLDILFYGDLVSGDSVLTLPHPDMANREFVLKPLDELCPWQYNPVNGKTVRQMLRELEEKPYIDTPVKSSY